jgi:hypothetical protein
VVHGAAIVDNSHANKNEIVLDFSKISPQDKKIKFAIKEDLYPFLVSTPTQNYKVINHSSFDSISIISFLKKAYKKQPIKIYTGSRIIIISSEEYSSIVVTEKIHKNQTEKNTFRIPANEKIHQ